jgi:streptogramin lyase
MLQRFLDAADYWFGYSDTSNTGSYDPVSGTALGVPLNNGEILT